jgi:hypothetical protein
MPLRDHFHGPVPAEINWESFHSAWANTLVRQLNERFLPGRYRAAPEVRLGVDVRIDVAAFERLSPGTEATGGTGVLTAAWAPAKTTRCLEVTFPAQDVFEVRVLDGRRRLVGAIELVSPGNKDRPGARRDFAIKCAAYLQQRVGVVIVDIVTERHGDLYGELLSLLGQERGEPWPGEPPLYAVALRTTKVEDCWRMDTWEELLTLGQLLPTMPLWLADNLVVPVELEGSYEETYRVLKLE